MASVAGCILECFYTLIEYLTKFATVMMSITGACGTCNGTKLASVTARPEMSR